MVFSIASTLHFSEADRARNVPAEPSPATITSKLSSKTGAAKPGVPNGTYLEFEPDKELFGKYNFNMEYVEKRLWNYAYLNPGLTIKCNGKDYYSENGIQDLLLNEMGGVDKSLYNILNYKSEKSDTNLQFVLTHGASLDKFVYSFVNGQSTDDGGTHVTGFRSAFTRCLNDLGKENGIIKDKDKINSDDYREGLVVIVSVKIPEKYLQFESKTYRATRTKTWITIEHIKDN